LFIMQFFNGFLQSRNFMYAFDRSAPLPTILVDYIPG
jgi:hypothetical protein